MSNINNSLPDFSSKFNLYTLPLEGQKFLASPTATESRSIALCTLELQAAYANFYKYAPKHKVISTLRTRQYQATVYAKGRTAPGNIVTKARPGYSYHNYGVCFDAVPMDDKGLLVWDKKNKLWQEMRYAANQANLEWGGLWEFQDFPHFQLKNLPEFPK
jgi:hypothetical protein